MKRRGRRKVSIRWSLKNSNWRIKVDKLWLKLNTSSSTSTLLVFCSPFLQMVWVLIDGMLILFGFSTVFASLPAHVLSTVFHFFLFFSAYFVFIPFFFYCLLKVIWFLQLNWEVAKHLTLAVLLLLLVTVRANSSNNNSNSQQQAATATAATTTQSPRCDNGQCRASRSSPSANSQDKNWMLPNRFLLHRVLSCRCCILFWPCLCCDSSFSFFFVLYYLEWQMIIKKSALCFSLAVFVWSFRARACVRLHALNPASLAAYFEVEKIAWP